MYQAKVLVGLLRWLDDDNFGAIENIAKQDDNAMRVSDSSHATHD